MSYSYLDAVRGGFKAVMAIADGDPYVYNNIQWTGGDAVPSQDDLDAWIKGTPGGDASKTLTRYAFRQLFTLNERVACDNFQSVEAIPANYKAILVTLFKDLELSGEIQLDNPAVAQGVGMLEQLGLIAAGRAAQIMSNTPPAPA